MKDLTFEQENLRKLLTELLYKGIFHLSYQDLRKEIGLETKYRRYADFKRFILKPVLSNLRTTLGVDLWVQEIRGKHGIETLRFGVMANIIHTEGR